MAVAFNCIKVSSLVSPTEDNSDLILGKMELIEHGKQEENAQIFSVLEDGKRLKLGQGIPSTPRNEEEVLEEGLINMDKRFELQDKLIKENSKMLSTILDKLNALEIRVVTPDPMIETRIESVEKNVRLKIDEFANALQIVNRNMQVSSLNKQDSNRNMQGSNAGYEEDRPCDNSDVPARGE